MGTTIRPELSEKNPYWIERHRYYELKHFCLQYPIWKKAYAALDGLSRRPSDLEVFSKKGEISDPTDTIIFYSQNYSYKIMQQSAGRIDRLNTPFKDLYYYHLKSRSGIDLAISKALKEKKDFNETRFVKW